MKSVYRCMAVCLVLGGMVDALPQSAVTTTCGLDRVSGQPRQEGDTWYDGCNQCRCLSKGRSGCTKKLCPPQQRKTCGGRSSWEEKSGQEVRQCRCALGEAACNPVSNQCGLDTDGRQRLPGDRWKDSCNTCFCTETGLPACTLQLCQEDLPGSAPISGPVSGPVSTSRINFPTKPVVDRKPDTDAERPVASLLQEVSLRDGDVAQCHQDGVTKCTGVRIATGLSQLRAGAILTFLQGTGITMKLRRDPDVSSISTTLALSLTDGGEATITVGKSGAVYGSINPATGNLLYALESCGKDCTVLLQRNRDFFNNLKD